jgi:hypothetical protein
MTHMLKLLTAAAAVGGLAAPAAAQYQQPYPQTYPQTYPQQYPQTYPGYPQGYGYQQGYGNNPVGQIIDQLLGNRYSVTDRQAVRQCATAVIAQAQSQYGGGYNGYNGNNGYNRGYSNLRVTSIDQVERRQNGLRVRGTLSSSYGGGGYGGQYGYQNRGYGDLSFRCNVDYRGAVTNIRINRADRYRG